MTEIKLIRLITGEEVVAEVLEDTETTVKVQNALVVLPQASGGVGFAPWATVIDVDKPEIVLKKEHVVYLVDVQPQVADKYNEVFGATKLVTPPEKKLIL